MDPVSGLAPEPAERARSALRRCSHGTLTTDGGRGHRVVLAHVDDEAGSVVVGTEGPWSGGVAPTSARLVVTDEILGAGPAAGTVRLWVESAGPVLVPDVPTQRRIARRLADQCPDPALLGVGTGATLHILRPESTAVVDRVGVSLVATDDLMTSGNDPFTDIEGLWIEHLNHPSCPVVPGIVRRLGSCGLPGPVLLTALDRFGVVLSSPGPDAERSVRVPFDEACVTVADLGRQIRLLVGCPRSPHALRQAREGSASRRER